MRILIAGISYEDSFADNARCALEEMGHEVRTLGDVAHARYYSPARYYARVVTERLRKRGISPDGRKLLKITRAFRPQVVLGLTREYPPEVAERAVPGHWEGDLILGAGNRTALGTLVERTTHTTLLIPLKAKDAQSVRQAFARRLRTVPRQMKLTLPYDRGEMAEHKLFSADTRRVVYFAHPQSLWERGINENTNGLIRQYFHRGTDFSQVSYYQIMKAQNQLNGRPRQGAELGNTV